MDALAESHAAVPPGLLAQLTDFENAAGLVKRKGTIIQCNISSRCYSLTVWLFCIVGAFHTPTHCATNVTHVLVPIWVVGG